MSDILNDLRKIMGDREAYRREYPVAIAISCNNQGKDALDRYSVKSPAKSESPSGMNMRPLLPIGAVPVYVWRNQPELVKAHYDKEEFMRWFEAYAEKGDRAPFMINGVTPVKE